MLKGMTLKETQAQTHLPIPETVYRLMDLAVLPGSISIWMAHEILVSLRNRLAVRSLFTAVTHPGTRTLEPPELMARS